MAIILYFLSTYYGKEIVVCIKDKANNKNGHRDHGAHILVGGRVSNQVYKSSCTFKSVVFLGGKKKSNLTQNLLTVALRTYPLN